MRVLITGASKGIGEALAYEFAKSGHDLILSARNEALLKELALKLQKQYQIKAGVIVADLSQSEGALDLIKNIEATNQKIDCLVNNAGIGYLGEFIDSPQTSLCEMLQINMIALSQLTHHFAKCFKNQGGGKILQVASIAAFQPGPYMAAYYATKAYVVSLSEALAYELRESKVSISILCPGPTKTNFWHQGQGDETILAKGRLGLMTADKVASKAYHGLMHDKLIIIPGFFNKILAYGARIAPNILTKRVSAFLHKSL